MTSQSKLFFRIFQIATVLIVCSGVVNTQTVDSKPKPVGSISGRVTVDGKGVAGIPVAAVEGQNVNRRDAPVRTTSDVEGNYRLTGLTQGNYQIWTLTPAHVAEPIAYPNYFPYGGDVRSILLGAGENVTDVNLKLLRGSVITGRVTTSDDKPVVDEHITLQLLNANGNPRVGAISSTYDQMFQTDDRGIYRIFDLPPGRYQVSVGSDSDSPGIGRASRRYRTSFYSEPNDPSKAAIVELQEGDEASGIDMKVELAPPTFSVSGRVVDTETGVSIAKAGVRLYPVKKDPNAGGGIGIQTDEQGEFSFSGFSPGRYSATPTSDIYGGNFYGDSVYFEIVDKDVNGIELKTVPGLSLSGTIAAEALSTKELLARLAGLTVMISGTSSGNGPVRTAGRAVVNTDGTFFVDGLRPGPVTFFVSTQRPSFIRVNIARLEQDGVPINQPFDLQQSVSNFRITLDYGTGSLRGTVKFEGGETPATDVRAYVTCRRAGSREGADAMTDARGNFVIPNLAAGEFEVTMTLSGVSPRPARPIPPQKKTVTIVNGTETEVTFVVDVSKPGGQ